LLGFSIVFFFSLSIILLNVFYEDYKKDIYKDTNLKLELIANQAKQNIQNNFETFIYILEQMAKNPDIIKNTGLGKENIAFTYENYFSHLKAVTRVNNLGRIIYTYPENQKVINTDISKQKHIYQLLVTQKPVISEVFWAVQGYYAIAIHVPVFDNGKFAGSIAFVLDFSKLSHRFLNDVNLGYGNKPLLLSKEGIVLFGKHRDTIGKQVLLDSSITDGERTLYTAMINGNNGFYTIKSNFGNNNLEFFTVFKKIPLFNTYWSIAIFIGKNEIINPLNQFKNRLLFIFALMFIGGVTFVFFITKAWGIISKQKEIKEYLVKLEESEKRYKTLFEDNHTIKVLFNADTLDIVDVNSAAINFYGYTKEEFLKLKIFDLNIIQPETVKANIKNTLTNLSAYYEFKHKLKDGTTKDVEVYAGVIEFNNNKFIMANIHDATEKKKIAEALLKSKEDAEKANKLKDAFIANISHEIRTPLNGILGMTSLIKESLAEHIGSDEMEFFNGIDRSSRRIIRTIDMIINYSRFQVGDFPYNPQTTNIDILLKSIIKDFKGTFDAKAINLEYSNKLGNINLTIDEYSITQAIGNLLDNAAKFTYEGYTKIMLYKDTNNNICLDIKDTGIGISEEYIAILFNPYTQEEIGYNRSFEGIGLGLSLVKKYLDLNKCTLTVTSEKNKGTTFTIKFPQ
jgi:PAS domain S-box-containing protein